MNDDILSAASDVYPAVRSDVERLVRIPSVSAAGFDPDFVRASATATAEILEEVGFEQTRLLELDGAHPGVFAELPAPPGAPTVLLYAHHDVQPAGPAEEWNTAPFEPVERDGRLFGRGTSDDKCGVALHAAMGRLFGATPPVGIKVFAEGEEEIGSRHLLAFLERYGDLLAADAIVIADSENWRVGTPALTTSLRGLVDCVIEVRTLAAGVHSGQFGGVLPDALTTLVRTLATLHASDGSVAVPGMVTAPAAPLDLTEAELREQAGAVAGVELIGTGTLTARMWTQPSVSVLAIDAPPISEAINQLVPVARAKVSLRLAPGDDPKRAMEALIRHLESNVPWGATVSVTPGSSGEAFALSTEGPAFDAFRSGMRAAWGRDPVEIGVGGSIPFVGAFAEAYPEASILITGVADPASSAHGPNESLDLDELRRGVAAQAIALASLAGVS
jgi:acetylornithine deacetylase/succinyl-diaminopimelate desuccinylase-like protein